MFEGRARLAGADLALVDEETVTQELDMYADFGADHPTFHFQSCLSTLLSLNMILEEVSKSSVLW